MIRDTFSGEKNSAIGTVPASVPKKRSVWAWWSRKATNNCRNSGGNGLSEPRCTVLSYIGMTVSLRTLFVVGKRLPQRLCRLLRPASTASAIVSASRNASVMPWAGIGCL